MNGAAKTVMWLGVLLIIARMFTSGQWQSLWSKITTGTSAAPAPAAPGGKDPCAGFIGPGLILCRQGQSQKSSSTTTGNGVTATYI